MNPATAALRSGSPDRRVEPAELFARAAKQSPAELRDTVRDFGQRRDITLSSFAWVLDQTPDDPAYRSTMMYF